MPIWYPDRVDVAIIARELAAQYFPPAEDAPPSIFGILAGDEGAAALESALGIVRQPYYRYVHSKAGALMRSLVQNHPFIDGNKRIAVITTVTFLLMNNHYPYATDASWVDLALEIASSEDEVPWRYVARQIRSQCVCWIGTPEQNAARLAGHEKQVTDRVDRLMRALGMI
jgi:death-on-curing protein